MRFKASNNDQVIDDHYVAFLSNGANPTSSQQHNKRLHFASSSKVGSKIAKLSAIAIALVIIGGALILFLSAPSADPTVLKTSIINFGAPSNSDFIASHNKDSVDAVASSLTNNHVVQAFEEFVVRHGKVYASIEEKARRLEVFAKNLLFIHLHNAQNFTYSLASNAFTDLTYDEFRNHHFTGYRTRRKDGLLGATKDDHTDWDLLNVDPSSLPEAVNWRDKGCVTEIKDQRKCGACWAFSASGAVEGSYCAKYGQLKNLSEQQMVDCGGPEGNEGCNGGEMDDAFQYIIDRGGLCTEDEYPYTAHEGRCRDKECTPVANVLKFLDVPHKSEKALKAAVALKGPVSVAIQADQLPFQFYHNGVFDASCGKNLNHGVLVVGYGTDADSGKDYWLVKNSWGTKWGEQGFIKLLRNDGSRAGECGILMEPSYPLIQ